MDENRSSAIARLSERQRQCLELVAQGFTSKEIGRQLGLSPSTIDAHLSGALDRLNLSDRAEAARRFRESQHVRHVTPQQTQVVELAERSSFRLPPLGGQVNNLSARRRVWHIVQIALMGIMGMTAAVVTIAGLVNLFSGR
jgi:DNA-binding CsgD family transcriptional regulator